MGFRGIELRVFSATKSTIGSMHESMSASMTQFRNAGETSDTRLQRFASFRARNDRALRGALEGDDRQVPSAAAVLDVQFDLKRAQLVW